MPSIPFTAAVIIKYMAYGPCFIRRIHGWNNQAANVYIQLHQTPPLANSTLTAGAVPYVKSLGVTPNNGFDFEFVNSIEMNECLVALSSTEANYTAVLANAGLDMTFEIDSDFLAADYRVAVGVQGQVAVVGDATTTRNTLQVWSEAAGTNPTVNNIGRLYRVDVTEQLGTARFIAVLPYDAVSTWPTGVTLGSIPPGGWAFVPLPASGTVNLTFGRKGITPYLRDSNGTERKGCSVFVVDNITAPFTQTANSAVIRSISGPLVVL